MSYIIGTDTGGTFTDTVVVADDGSVTIGKRPSTPPEFVDGVRASVGDAAAKLGTDVERLLSATEAFLHGTTIAINAIVTRQVAPIGFLTTKGFGDTVFVARAASRTAGLTGDQLHAFAHLAKPPPLIPATRQLVREIPERVDWKGSELVALDEAAVQDAVCALLREGVEGIAVCYLWAFMNPAHEQRTRELVAQLAPDLPVSLSSELAPKLGEYERMTTTGFNAALVPRVADYLGRLELTLTGAGLPVPPLIMQGNGGVLTARDAARQPVSMINSGPAGGVLGAKFLADEMGIRDVICTDVGGTTFDVGLIVDGRPLINPNAVIDQHKLHLPVVDIVSIGAGGGSLARAEGGRLHVGPQSAGANPGPVCYGRGGTLPTVTDADLVLGFLRPDYFLDGAMTLDVGAARKSIDEHVATPLGMSIEEAAAGIVRIADSHMADLIRQVTVERGHDPRRFTAFLYGGNGPLHGTAYGANLGLAKMVVPGAEIASVFSAWGVAVADIHHSLEMSHPLTEPYDAGVVNEVFAALEKTARERLHLDGVPEGRQVLQRMVEMRFRLQSHEVAVPVPGGELGDQGIADVRTAFEAAYERLYGEGSALTAAGTEIITFRVHAYGRLRKPEFTRKRDVHPDAGSRLDDRDVLWPGPGRLATRVVPGSVLRPGFTVTGPALVELPTTVVAVRPDQRLEADDMLNLHITEEGGI